MTEVISKSRQSIRSIKMLQDAFLSLMKEKPYEKIKITEIADRANLARSTFYSHFETKHNLVESFLDQIFDPYFDALIEKGNISEHNPEKEIELQTNLFRYWGENYDILCILQKTNIHQIVLEKLRKHHRKFYEQKISVILPDLGPALAAYRIRYLAATTYSLILQWSEDGRKIPPETMGKMLFTLTGPHITKKMMSEFSEVIK